MLNKFFRLKGSKSRVVLNKNQTQEIRKKLANTTALALAIEYKVSRKTIGKVKNRRSPYAS